MLVLSRTPGKRIIIDNHIVITVLSFFGDQVRIGIEAPENITVHREEIQEKINKNKCTIIHKKRKPLLQVVQ